MNLYTHEHAKICIEKNEKNIIKRNEMKSYQDPCVNKI